MAALMDSEVAALRLLLEKDKMRQNSINYFRGMDRMDLELMKSAYWADGTDNHGPFSGNAHEFCEYAYNQRESYRVMMHHASNMQIQIIDHLAKVEIYFICLVGLYNPNTDCFLGGRYKDLYEKRGEEWKILRRVVLWDWNRVDPSSTLWSALQIVPDEVNEGARYPADPIYKSW